MGLALDLVSSTTMKKTGTEVKEFVGKDLTTVDGKTVTGQVICSEHRIKYGENTKLKQLGVDEVWIRKPLGEQTNKLAKSRTRIFTNIGSFTCSSNKELQSVITALKKLVRK